MPSIISQESFTRFLNSYEYSDATLVVKVIPVSNCVGTPKADRDCSAEQPCVPTSERCDDLLPICEGDKIVPVHKILLAAQSPYFARLFSSGTAGTSSTHSHWIIRVAEPEALALALRFMYYNACLCYPSTPPHVGGAKPLERILYPELNPLNAWSLRHLAVMFEIQSLVIAIEAYLERCWEGKSNAYYRRRFARQRVSGDSTSNSDESDESYVLEWYSWMTAAVRWRSPRLLLERLLSFAVPSPRGNSGDPFTHMFRIFIFWSRLFHHLNRSLNVFQKSEPETQDTQNPDKQERGFTEEEIRYCLSIIQWADLTPAELELVCSDPLLPEDLRAKLNRISEPSSTTDQETAFDGAGRVGDADKQPDSVVVIKRDSKMDIEETQHPENPATTIKHPIPNTAMVKSKSTTDMDVHVAESPRLIAPIPIKLTTSCPTALLEGQLRALEAAGERYEEESDGFFSELEPAMLTACDPVFVPEVKDNKSCAKAGPIGRVGAIGDSHTSVGQSQGFAACRQTDDSSKNADDDSGFTCRPNLESCLARFEWLASNDMYTEMEDEATVKATDSGESADSDVSESRQKEDNHEQWHSPPESLLPFDINDLDDMGVSQQEHPPAAPPGQTQSVQSSLLNLDSSWMISFPTPSTANCSSAVASKIMWQDKAWGLLESALLASNTTEAQVESASSSAIPTAIPRDLSHLTSVSTFAVSSSWARSADMLDEQFGDAGLSAKPRGVSDVGNSMQPNGLLAEQGFQSSFPDPYLPPPQHEQLLPLTSNASSSVGGEHDSEGNPMAQCANDSALAKNVNLWGWWSGYQQSETERNLKPVPPWPKPPELVRSSPQSFSEDSSGGHGNNPARPYFTNDVQFDSDCVALMEAKRTAIAMAAEDKGCQAPRAREDIQGHSQQPMQPKTTYQEEHPVLQPQFIAHGAKASRKNRLPMNNLHPFWQDWMEMDNPDADNSNTDGAVVESGHYGEGTVRMATPPRMNLPPPPGFSLADLRAPRSIPQPLPDIPNDDEDAASNYEDIQMHMQIEVSLHASGILRPQDCSDVNKEVTFAPGVDEVARSPPHNSAGKNVLHDRFKKFKNKLRMRPPSSSSSSSSERVGISFGLGLVNRMGSPPVCKMTNHSDGPPPRLCSPPHIHSKSSHELKRNLTDPPMQTATRGFKKKAAAAIAAVVPGRKGTNHNTGENGSGKLKIGWMERKRHPAIRNPLSMHRELFEIKEEGTGDGEECSEEGAEHSLTSPMRNETTSVLGSISDLGRQSGREDRVCLPISEIPSSDLIRNSYDYDTVGNNDIDDHDGGDIIGDILPPDIEVPYCLQPSFESGLLSKRELWTILEDEGLEEEERRPSPKRKMVSVADEHVELAGVEVEAKVEKEHEKDGEGTALQDEEVEMDSFDDDDTIIDRDKTFRASVFLKATIDSPFDAKHQDETQQQAIAAAVSDEAPVQADPDKLGLVASAPLDDEQDAKAPDIEEDDQIEKLDSFLEGIELLTIVGDSNDDPGSGLAIREGDGGGQVCEQQEDPVDVTSLDFVLEQLSITEPEPDSFEADQDGNGGGGYEDSGGGGYHRHKHKGDSDSDSDSSSDLDSDFDGNLSVLNSREEGQQDEDDLRDQVDPGGVLVDEPCLLGDADAEDREPTPKASSASTTLHQKEKATPIPSCATVLFPESNDKTQAENVASIAGEKPIEDVKSEWDPGSTRVIDANDTASARSFDSGDDGGLVHGEWWKTCMATISGGTIRQILPRPADGLDFREAQQQEQVEPPEPPEPHENDEQIKSQGHGAEIMEDIRLVVENKAAEVAPRTSATWHALTPSAIFQRGLVGDMARSAVGLGCESGSGNGPGTGESESRTISNDTARRKGIREDDKNDGGGGCGGINSVGGGEDVEDYRGVEGVGGDEEKGGGDEDGTAGPDWSQRQTSDLLERIRFARMKYESESTHYPDKTWNPNKDFKHNHYIYSDYADYAEDAPSSSVVAKAAEAKALAEKEPAFGLCCARGPPPPRGADVAAAA
ncbi:hypothetical protein HK102_011271, partial [Quaeritorhiza haematococci]